MIYRSPSVKITILFIYLIAFLWFILGLILVIDVHLALPDLPMLKLGMAFLSFILSGILIVLGSFISRKSRMAFFLGIGLLSLITILSIFDDIGMADLVFLIINLIPLILLLKDRHWYLQPGSTTIEERFE